MILAHLLTSDDRLSPQKLAGCAIGIVGVAVMIGIDFLHGLGNNVLGQFAMLGATCCYGFAAVYGRRFKNTPHAVSAAGMLLGATVLILPAALILERPWTLHPGVLSLGALIGLALFSTALAFVVWFRLIQTAGPSNTSLVTFIIPFTALVLGVLLLGEEPTGSSIFGLLIILTGLGVTQLRVFRRAPITQRST